MRVIPFVNFMKDQFDYDFYALEFPTSQANSGFVRIDGGSSPDVDITAIRYPTVQIGVRNDSVEAAEQVAYDVWRFFNAANTFEVGNDVRVEHTACMQSAPIYLHKDDNGRTIYTINIQLIII